MDLFVGQCGCQLGLQMYRPGSVIEKGRNRFSQRHNCVLVDTEPKVLTGAKTHPMISAQNVVFRQSGRANCWPYGYLDQEKVRAEGRVSLDRQDCLQENTLLLEEVLSRVRKNLEQTDLCQIIYLFHSLAGGTGSGLGCRLLEELSSEYPGLAVASLSVLPYQVGENALQHYNVLLSLSSLIQHADFLLYFENDKLGPLLQRETNRSIGHQDINHFILENYRSLLRTDRTHPDSFSLDILRNLTSHDPSLKCLQMTSHSRENTSDPPLKHLLRLLSLHRQQQHDSCPTLYGSHLSFPESSFFDSPPAELQQMVRHTLGKHYSLQPGLLNHLVDVSTPSQTPSDFLLTNSSDTATLLASVEEKSLLKMHSRAYLHYFYETGMEELDFREALERLSVLRGAYRSA